MYSYVRKTGTWMAVHPRGCCVLTSMIGKKRKGKRKNTHLAILKYTLRIPTKQNKTKHCGHGPETNENNKRTVRENIYLYIYYIIVGYRDHNVYQVSTTPTLCINLAPPASPLPPKKTKHIRECKKLAPAPHIPRLFTVQCIYPHAPPPRFSQKEGKKKTTTHDDCKARSLLLLLTHTHHVFFKSWG